jgi:hypothetical protein
MSGLLSRIAVGLGEGAQVYGKLTLEKQREERLAALQEKMQKDTQEFQTSENKSNQSFTSAENVNQRDFQAEQNNLDRTLRLDSAKSKAASQNKDTVKDIQYADDFSGNMTITKTSGKQTRYDADSDTYYELGKGKPEITESMRDQAMKWGRDFAEQQAKTFGKDKTDFPVVQSEDRAGVLAGQLFLNAMTSGPEAAEKFKTEAAKQGFSFIEKQAVDTPEIVDSVKSGKLSTSKNESSTSKAGAQLQVAFDRYPNTDQKELAQAMIDSRSVPESVKKQARAFLKAN